jgi:hypothetical protein
MKFVGVEYGIQFTVFEMKNSDNLTLAEIENNNSDLIENFILI